jgi:hypothetical protein
MKSFIIPTLLKDYTYPRLVYRTCFLRRTVESTCLSGSGSGLIIPIPIHIRQVLYEGSARLTTTQTTNESEPPYIDAAGM